MLYKLSVILKNDSDAWVSTFALNICVKSIIFFLSVIYLSFILWLYFISLTIL